MPEFQTSVALVSFIVGLLTGFFGRSFLFRVRPTNTTQQDVGNQFVLVVVTTVWAASILYSFIQPSYQVSPLLHGLMGAIVGFFYRPFENRKK